MNSQELDILELRFSRVPRHTLESLHNYYDRGWEPGSFLMAVLRGDLFQAAARADHINKAALAYIAEYVVNESPVGSWGDAETVQEWLKGGFYFQAHEKKRVLDILSTP